MKDVFDFPYLINLCFIWFIILLAFFSFKAIKKKGDLNNNKVIVALGMASLGFVTGVIMGNNRNPISDTILSSVFTLLGSAIAYIMFTQKDNPENSGQSSIAPVDIKFSKEHVYMLACFLILFPISLLYGAHIGAKFRLENEDFQVSRDFQNKLKTDSLELWKKNIEDSLDVWKNKNQIYNQKVYETWSENEKKRFLQQLKFLKRKDSIPKVPDYFDDSN